MADPIRLRGYHGTSIEVADAILREGFRLSRNGAHRLVGGRSLFPPCRRVWPTPLIPHLSFITHHLSLLASDGWPFSGPPPSFRCARRNEPDWLRDGVYFFLNAPGRAWDWARDRHGSNAAVIGSTIRLEDCMNLLEPQWSSVLAEAYDSFLKQLKRAKLPLPVQTSGAHRLDRAVINYTVGILAEQGIKIRVVQEAFREGKPIYPNSALFNLSHVQIAVRDTSLIERSWRETA